METIDRLAEQAFTRSRRAGGARNVIDAEKLAEARRVLADDAADPSPYPLLAASANAASPWEIRAEALRVVERHEEFLASAARFEGLRLEAKRKIRGASNAEAVDEIVASYTSAFASALDSQA